ncbi:MAG TPA: hypothetical protein PLB62_02950 [Candidatus Sumerlaeota bacterium]|nr:hypothetical protein [Candidatus Sumerlaeota bacterium]
MKKTFDCVKMKHDIQQKIMMETSGMSEHEKQRWTEDLILSDPILSTIRKNARITRSSRRSVSSS